MSLCWRSANSGDDPQPLAATLLLGVGATGQLDAIVSMLAAFQAQDGARQLQARRSRRALRWPLAAALYGKLVAHAVETTAHHYPQSLSD